MKRTKHDIRKALFGHAKELGISSEMLRDDIAPAVIGKRISEANNYEIAKVIDYITARAGRKPTPAPLPGGEFDSPLPGGDLGVGKSGGDKGVGKKYPSSRAGLLEEIRDLAIARYGQADYAERLNNFCAWFGEADGYHKLKIGALKRLKARIIELNKTDPWEKE